MWVKICGIRDGQSFQHAIEAGADAIGLNFYPKSRRYVTPDAAARFCPADDSLCINARNCSRVEVVVNATPREIEQIVARVSVTHLQFHGDETVADLANIAALFPDLKLIRAWRLDERGINPLSRYLEECRNNGLQLSNCLVDSFATGEYGGSGQVADWSELAGWRSDWPQLILAGGLTPENVGAAIDAVGPWGVDVASGVEQSPGVKDPARVAKFIAAARTRDTH